jgi:hypothetical protein
MLNVLGARARTDTRDRAVERWCMIANATALVEVKGVTHTHTHKGGLSLAVGA